MAICPKCHVRRVCRMKRVIRSGTVRHSQRSRGIYLTAEETPVKAQLVDHLKTVRPVIASKEGPFKPDYLVTAELVTEQNERKVGMRRDGSLRFTM